MGSERGMLSSQSPRLLVPDLLFCILIHLFSGNYDAEDELTLGCDLYAPNINIADAVEAASAPGMWFTSPVRRCVLVTLSLAMHYANNPA